MTGRDYSHVPGDVRKRLIEADELAYSHDEQHAHLHEWPEPDVVLGED